MKLVAENLVCVRGDRQIFYDISFEVGAGTSLVLKGPNGAGKTSLLRMITGFLQPSSGVLKLEGGDPDLEIAQQCHYVGHLDGIKKNFSVFENASFYNSYLSFSVEGQNIEKINASLEAFRLTELSDFPAKILSAGQKRRLGLARLVAATRPIWVLDEPTVSLDTASQELLFEQVRKHVANGGMLITSTHIPLGIVFDQTITLSPGGVR